MTKFSVRFTDITERHTTMHQLLPRSCTVLSTHSSHVAVSSLGKSVGKFTNHLLEGDTDSGKTLQTVLLI